MSRILVIEDEATIRHNVVRMLELEGHHVFQAEDGAQGLKLAQTEKPALVLCDVNIPHMDGFAVLQAIRGDADLSSTSVVMLTAMTEQENQDRGFELGAAGYLTKPFTRAQLLQTLQQYGR
jgi:DNA-binding response OmpR family regulator